MSPHATGCMKAGRYNHQNMQILKFIVYILSMFGLCENWCLLSGIYGVVIPDPDYASPNCTIQIGNQSSPENATMTNSFGSLEMSNDPWLQAITFHVVMNPQGVPTCHACDSATSREQECLFAPPGGNGPTLSQTVKANFRVAATLPNKPFACQGEAGAVESYLLGGGDDKEASISISLDSLLSDGRNHQNLACGSSVKLLVFLAIDTGAPNEDRTVYSFAGVDDSNSFECEQNCPILGAFDCLFTENYRVVMHTLSCANDGDEDDRDGVGCVHQSLDAAYSAVNSRFPVLPSVCGTWPVSRPFRSTPTGSRLHEPYFLMRQDLLDEYYVSMLNTLRLPNVPPAVIAATNLAREILEATCHGYAPPADATPHLRNLTLTTAATLQRFHRGNLGVRSCNASQTNNTGGARAKFPKHWFPEMRSQFFRFMWKNTGPEDNTERLSVFGWLFVVLIAICTAALAACCIFGAVCARRVVCVFSTPRYLSHMQFETM